VWPLREENVDVLVSFKDDQGRELGTIVANAKQFKTASRGFYGNSKLEIDGKRYQVQIQMVEIGSKAAQAE
jgi:hypothetical protein